jgi:hypothetical protein
MENIAAKHTIYKKRITFAGKPAKHIICITPVLETLQAKHMFSITPELASHTTTHEFRES